MTDWRDTQATLFTASLRFLFRNWKAFAALSVFQVVFSVALQGSMVAYVIGFALANLLAISCAFPREGRANRAATMRAALFVAMFAVLFWLVFYVLRLLLAQFYLVGVFVALSLAYSIVFTWSTPRAMAAFQRADWTARRSFWSRFWRVAIVALLSAIIAMLVRALGQAAPLLIAWLLAVVAVMVAFLTPISAVIVTLRTVDFRAGAEV